MIRKTLFTFAGLFCLYAFILWKMPNLSATQNQNQTNYIQAEKYLYEDHSNRPATLVGTSLAARLQIEQLPEFNNLAFGGLSIYDGLDIVIKGDAKPKFLFVEINFFTKKASNEFLNAVFHPVTFRLKKYIPLFRSEKQPLGIFAQETIYMLKNRNKKASFGDARNKTRNNDTIPLLTKKDSMHLKSITPPNETVFKGFVKDYSKKITNEFINENLKNLKGKIDTLSKMGVEVIFFEMPINSELVESEQYIHNMAEFKKVFPDQLYSYVPTKYWGFQTADGIHLNQKEASVYTHYLKAFYQKKTSVDL
jgi:hypothetical protein